MKKCGPRVRFPTEGERKVIDLMILGKTNADIGQVLGLSPLTVKNVVAKIIRKMNVENRTQAVAKYLAPHLFTHKEA